MRGLAISLIVLAALAGAAGAQASPPGGEVDVVFAGLRSAKGLIRVCLTSEPKHFPHCEKDPAAQKRSIPAAPGARLAFTGVAAGRYALVVLHDENSNGKVDTMLGIPREGVGFSNNPAIVAGPPKLASALFTVGAGATTQTIRLKYFL